MLDAKKLFEQGLSDNPNMDPCKSNQPENEIEKDIKIRATKEDEQKIKNK